MSILEHFHVWVVFVIIANGYEARQNAFVALLFPLELVKHLIGVVISYFAAIALHTGVVNAFDESASKGFVFRGGLQTLQHLFTFLYL